LFTKVPYVTLQRIDQAVKELQAGLSVNVESPSLAQSVFKVPFASQTRSNTEKATNGDFSDSDDDADKVYISDSDATVLFGDETDHDLRTSPKRPAHRIHQGQREGVAGRLRTPSPKKTEQTTNVLSSKLDDAVHKRPQSLGKSTSPSKQAPRSPAAALPGSPRSPSEGSENKKRKVDSNELLRGVVASPSPKTQGEAPRKKKKRRPRMGPEKVIAMTTVTEGLNLQEIFTPGHKLRNRSAGPVDGHKSSSFVSASSTTSSTHTEAAHHETTTKLLSPSPAVFLTSLPMNETKYDPIILSSSDSVFDFGEENCQLPVISSPRRRRQKEEERAMRASKSVVNFSMENMEEVQTRLDLSNRETETDQTSINGDDREFVISNVSLPAMPRDESFTEPAVRLTKSADVPRGRKKGLLSKDIATAVRSPVVLRTPVAMFTPTTRTGRRYSGYSSWKQQIKNAELRAKNKARSEAGSASEDASTPDQGKATTIFTPSIQESVKQAESRRRQSTIPTPDMETTVANIAENIAKSVLQEPPSTSSNLQPTAGAGSRQIKSAKEASVGNPNFNSDLSKFECKKCHATFQKHVNLVRHKYNNCQDRFFCDICGNSFGRRESLTMHKQIHTGEAAVDCEVCGRHLSNAVALKVHMRIHTDEKPFECAICLKRFRQQPALASHLRTHTGVRPFKCDLCPKTYRHSKNLYNHKLSHTGERKHPCLFCPSAFFTVSF
jgi:hypothetical protein